jgi:hypothetical protein
VAAARPCAASLAMTCDRGGGCHCDENVYMIIFVYAYTYTNSERNACIHTYPCSVMGSHYDADVYTHAHALFNCLHNCHMLYVTVCITTNGLYNCYRAWRPPAMRARAFAFACACACAGYLCVRACVRGVIRITAANRDQTHSQMFMPCNSYIYRYARVVCISTAARGAGHRQAGGAGPGGDARGPGAAAGAAGRRRGARHRRLQRPPQRRRRRGRARPRGPGGRAGGAGVDGGAGVPARLVHVQRAAARRRPGACVRACVRSCVLARAWAWAWAWARGRVVACACV